jgi:hypothetical protein
MKSIIKKLSLLSILIITIGWDNDNDPTNYVCDENYVTSAITNAFSISNGFDDLSEYMDLNTQVLGQGTILSK